MEDYTFIDFDNGSVQRAIKFVGREMLISSNKHSMYIRLSNSVSDEIDRKSLDRLRIRIDNLTGDIYLVFNCSIGLSFHKRIGRKTISINSKELVEKLNSLIKNNELKRIEKLSDDLSNSDLYATYKIMLRK